jgi:hypothetical protein
VQCGDDRCGLSPPFGGALQCGRCGVTPRAPQGDASGALSKSIVGIEPWETWASLDPAGGSATVTVTEVPGATSVKAEGFAEGEFVAARRVDVG